MEFGSVNVEKCLFRTGILHKKRIYSKVEQVRVFSNDAAAVHPFSRYATITFYCDCTADRSPRMDLLPVGIGRNLCRCNIRETANGAAGLWRFAARCSSLFHFERSREKSGR